jgi:hypothetical protein
MLHTNWIKVRYLKIELSEVNFIASRKYHSYEDSKARLFKQNFCMLVFVCEFLELSIDWSGRLPLILVM